MPRRPRRSARPAARPGAAPFASSVAAESLEARRLLTTYVVDLATDIVADDGRVSLREAVQAAETNARVFDADPGDPGRDVITFADGLTSVRLTSALAPLTDSLVIDGRDDVVTVEGGSGFLAGILTLNGTAGGEFDLADLTFSGGSGGSAGAVLVTGGATVVMDGVSFVNNVSGGGGALTVDGDATVAMSGGAFSSNRASGSARGGAATVLSGTLRVDGTDFADNRSDGAGGGAVAVIGGAFTSVGGDFTNNFVGRPASGPGIGPGFDGRGGAIFVGSGGSALVVRAAFRGNIAADGGAIYNAGTFGLRNADLAGNFAFAEASSGGAILADGGTFYGRDVTAVGNAANRAGGAVEVVAGTFTLDRFALNGNGAGGEDFDGFPPAPGNGGALHVTGSATVNLVNGDVRDNFAAAEGGGLWNQAGATMSLDRVVLVGNVADGDAADQGGGAIFNNGGTLRVERSVLVRNVAAGIAGSGGGIASVGGTVRVVAGTLSENVANRAGGGVEAVDTDLVVEASSRIVNNVAGPSGGARPGNGGGIHAAGDGTTSVLDSRVSANDARAEGGGLWNGADAEMTLRNVALSGNRARGRDADQGGGGLYNDGGTVEFVAGFIGDNRALGAAGSGGGVFTRDGRVEISDTNLARNAASRAGGAIEVVDGDLRVTESNVLANTAGGGDGPGNGGAVHVSGSLARVVFRGGAVARNTAASEGGGLWNQAGSRMILRDVRVRNNAAIGGGGIYNNGGRVDVRGRTRVDNNVADSNGGGISTVSGGFTVVERSAVRRNSSDFGGGLFVGRFSEAVLRDAAFTGNSPGDFAGAGFVGGDTDGLREG